MCSGSEAGSYLRLIDFCITELSRLESVFLRKHGVNSSLLVAGGSLDADRIDSVVRVREITALPETPSLLAD
jgi:hypothetical protein